MFSGVQAVDTLDLGEFPFVAELPKREKRAVVTAWDMWQEAKELIAAKGNLIPLTLAADLGGVSKQRISDLVRAGRLERVALGNHVFVTESSLLSWVRSERKPGRPWPSTIGDRLKTAAKMAGDYVSSRK
jgi:hypothetical protein